MLWFEGRIVFVPEARSSHSTAHCVVAKRPYPKERGYSLPAEVQDFSLEPGQPRKRQLLFFDISRHSPDFATDQGHVLALGPPVQQISPRDGCPGNRKPRIAGLARSTFHLFAIVKQIVDAKAQFRSSAEPCAYTERLMIAVLGGLADVERDPIRIRTAEGRSRAKTQEQHMGRPQQQQETRQRRAERATLKELAQPYNVGRATFSRLTA
jgi:Resolvase, N terminal domain